MSCAGITCQSEFVICSEAPAIISEGSICSRQAEAQAKQFTESSCHAFGRRCCGDLNITSASDNASERRGQNSIVLGLKKSSKPHREGVRLPDLKNRGVEEDIEGAAAHIIANQSHTPLDTNASLPYQSIPHAHTISSDTQLMTWHLVEFALHILPHIHVPLSQAPIRLL